MHLPLRKLHTGHPLKGHSPLSRRLQLLRLRRHWLESEQRLQIRGLGTRLERQGTLTAAEDHHHQLHSQTDIREAAATVDHTNNNRLHSSRRTSRRRTQRSVATLKHPLISNRLLSNSFPSRHRSHHFKLKLRLSHRFRLRLHHSLRQGSRRRHIRRHRRKQRRWSRHPVQKTARQRHLLTLQALVLVSVSDTSTSWPCLARVTSVRSCWQRRKRRSSSTRSRC